MTLTPQPSRYEGPLTLESALGALPLEALAERGCRVDCAPDRHGPAPTLRHARLTWHTPQQALNWMSNEAMGTAIVPPEILSTLFNGLDAK